MLYSVADISGMKEWLSEWNIGWWARTRGIKMSTGQNLHQMKFGVSGS